MKGTAEGGKAADSRGDGMRVETVGIQRGSAKRRPAIAATTCTVVVSLFSFVAIYVASPEAVGATAQASTDTGFSQPFAGPPEYLPFADTEVVSPAQLHAPIGQARADEIAAQLGLDEADAFTPQQYLDFTTGQGVGGDPEQAKLVDESARIFTNTVGRPLPSVIDGQVTGSVLASYGIFVNDSGLLMSLANTDAPTRQANSVIAPGGYLGTWCRANGCEATVQALYASAYREVVVYGLFSQQISGVAQLVTNTKGGVSAQVGMSMAPSIWFTNFALLYLLNPEVAAEMPAYWAPIPPTVADAILASPAGQVPYCEYASLLGSGPIPCPTPPPSTSTSTSTSPPPGPPPTTVPAVAPVVVASPRFTG